MNAPCLNKDIFLSKHLILYEFVKYCIYSIPPECVRQKKGHFYISFYYCANRLEAK